MLASNGKLKISMIVSRLKLRKILTAAVGELVGELEGAFVGATVGFGVGDVVGCNLVKHFVMSFEK